MLENLLPCPLIYAFKAAASPEAPPPSPRVPGLLGLDPEPGGPGEGAVASGAQEQVLEADLGPDRCLWLSVRLPARHCPAWSTWALIRRPPAREDDSDAAGGEAADALDPRGPAGLGWAVPGGRGEM